jgi:hypothetical protein
MWNETKGRSFSLLCVHERQGTLIAEEQATLDGLYSDIEEMEAVSLRPATERRQQETEQLRVINMALRDVMRRKEEHLARMKATLAKLRVEREALDAELEQVLA